MQCGSAGGVSLAFTCQAPRFASRDIEFFDGDSENPHLQHPSIYAIFKIVQI